MRQERGGLRLAASSEQTRHPCESDTVMRNPRTGRSEVAHFEGYADGTPCYRFDDSPGPKPAA
jgi:hypothetical protein